MREKILAMEAGLEIDMLVGQYVIGFEDYLKESGKRPVVRDGRYGKNYFDLPNYSTDISAAWEVWLKLCAIDCVFPKIVGRRVVSIEYSNGNLPFDVVGTDAPEAICKASLLAVMKP